MRRRLSIPSLFIAVLAISSPAYAAPVAAAPELHADQLTTGLALACAVLLVLSHRRVRAPARS